MNMCILFYPRINGFLNCFRKTRILDIKLAQIIYIVCKINGRTIRKCMSIRCSNMKSQ